MNKPNLLMVLAATTAIAVISGCSDNKTPSAPGGSSASTPSRSGTIALAFVTNNPSDYWTICRKGTEAAAKELGDVTVQFVMPDDGTAATQKRDVDDLLAKGVKGIAISPVDPANETTYLNDVAGKANLITSDSDAASSKRLCYIGTDNHAAGLMAGDLLKQALPAGGKVVLFVGKRDAQNAKDREQGIRDAIKGARIDILDVRTDDADHARAKANAADTLVKYSDVAALVGLWSYNAPAILSAVKDAGKIGKVKIVGFDQEEDTLGGLKTGAIFGTVVQQPYQFGYQSVKLLEQLAKGDKGGLPKTGLVIVPTQAIKPDGVAAYIAGQNKLLGK